MLLARGLRADAVPAGSSPVDAAVTATGTRPPAPVSIATPSVETEALAALAPQPELELLWASPREVLNIRQAEQVGVHIITV